MDDEDAAPEQGPWDAADAPAGVSRIDLGALQVPIVAELEVQLNTVDDDVVAATVLQQGSAVQMQAFSAPKSDDVWYEVRRELTDSIRSSGGSAEEVEGTFGIELSAQVPMEMPDAEGLSVQSLRFIGIDGPRWFLQCVFSGDAAVDGQQAALLEQVVRGTVVVRGEAPLPPRELLELQVPPEAKQDATQ